MIGGSFAKYLKQKLPKIKILATDNNQESLEIALDNKIIDNIYNFNDLDDKIDLIIIATPLSQYEAIFDKISKINYKTSLEQLHMPLIIDFGSIKNFKFKNIPKNFIGCHPIAGSHKYGFEHSDANIFYDKKIIICKENHHITKFFNDISLDSLFIEPKKHDQIYGLISHLPQFLSFMLSDFTPKVIDKSYDNIFRLLDSNPDIWNEIFTFNNDIIEKYYYEFFNNIENNFHLLNNQKINIFIDKSINLSTKYNINCNNLNISFFENNFSLLFFRIIVIMSYLEINDISKYHNYQGPAFLDFINLLAIIKNTEFNISYNITKNIDEINNLFDKIS